MSYLTKRVKLNIKGENRIFEVCRESIYEDIASMLLHEYFEGVTIKQTNDCEIDLLYTHLEDYFEHMHVEGEELHCAND